MYFMYTSSLKLIKGCMLLNSLFNVQEKEQRKIINHEISPFFNSTFAESAIVAQYFFLANL